MRISLFCGSTGIKGANRALLDLVARMMRENGAEVGETGDVGGIPIFRPELVDDAPTSVTDLRHAFSSVSGVVLAVPEYGGGAAGGAKNALDWMVGSGSLYERPVVVLSAGTSGGANAIEQMARTLTWQGAFVVAVAGIATPAAKRDESGAFVDPVTIDRVDTVIRALEASIVGEEVALRQLAASTVRALGIDPFRRSGH